VASALRFASELIAWIGAPWALAPHSVLLAIGSVVVLIGLPTMFQTPGDKARVVVPVPGVVTVLLVLLQLVAAVVAAWFAWPTVVAIVVSALAAACLVTEQPRWRWLLSRQEPPAPTS
jgi:Zn-dependent protease with chaperone function